MGKLASQEEYLSSQKTNTLEREILSQCIFIQSWRENCIVVLNTNKGRIEWIKDNNEEIKRHFQDRFQEPCSNWPFLDGVNFNQLSDYELLEEPFCLKKAQGDVWLCDDEKSPGPNDFKMGLYKKCWDISKEAIVLLMN